MIKGQSERLLFVIKDSNTDNFLKQILEVPTGDGLINNITSTTPEIMDAIKIRTYADCLEIIKGINGSWDIVPCRAIEYIETIDIEES